MPPKSHPRPLIGLNLSLRLTLWYALFFVVAILGIFAITYFLLSGFVRNHEVEILESRAQEYRAWLEEGGLPALKARFDEQRTKNRDSFFIRVITPDSQVIFTSMGNGATPLETSIIQGLQARTGITDLTTNSSGNIAHWTILSQVINSKLVLQVGKNSNEALQILSELKSIFFKAFLPLVILALAGGGLITYTTTRPLRDLGATLHRLLEENNLDARVPIRTHDPELSRLTALFNRLLEVNSKLIATMRESLDNAAHDLRTPLTRLRNSAELALGQGKNMDDLREGLSDCLEESEHVLKMLEVTLDVAEAKSGALKLNKSITNLTTACHRMVELYELASEEKQIHLTVEEKHSASVFVDPVRLEQIIGNLVDNALKYSPPKTTITLQIDCEDKYGIFKIIDQGMGIPEKDLPRIWDRLYRGDLSRSQRGLGLGLSLVQAVVTAHQGTIEVKSVPNQGSTFTVKLPIAS